jgi:hypothetical protein
VQCGSYWYTAQTCALGRPEARRMHIPIRAGRGAASPVVVMAWPASKRRVLEHRCTCRALHNRGGGGGGVCARTVAPETCLCLPTGVCRLICYVTCRHSARFLSSVPFCPQPAAGPLSCGGPPLALTSTPAIQSRQFRKSLRFCENRENYIHYHIPQTVCAWAIRLSNTLKKTQNTVERPHH